MLTKPQVRDRNEVLNVYQEFCMFNAFVSKIEPKTVKVALEHLDSVVAMQVELAEFDRNKVWMLIPKPKDVYVDGLKWVFKNKLIRKGMLLTIRQDLLLKVTVNKKVLITMNPSLLSQDSKQFAFFLPMQQLTRTLMFIKWTSNVHLSMVFLNKQCVSNYHLDL